MSVRIRKITLRPAALAAYYPAVDMAAKVIEQGKEVTAMFWNLGNGQFIRWKPLTIGYHGSMPPPPRLKWRRPGERTVQ